MSKWIALSLLSCSALLANDYSFVNKDQIFHVETRYRAVGRADFRTQAVKPSHVNYSDGYGKLFLSHYVSENNALSWELGYSYLNFDWKKNPRFRQDIYNFARVSVGWISTTLDRWRWVLHLGTRLDLNQGNFTKTGLVYGLAWGRYQYNSWVGIHAGFVGFVGVKNEYMLPILGADWFFAKKWQINTVFPCDFSLRYHINESFSSALSYASFGGMYREPYRAQKGIGDYHNAIFKIYSQGFQLDLKYQYLKYLTAKLGAGWDFGGWIYIKNSDNHHGRYYRYNAAPFLQANIECSF